MPFIEREDGVHLWYETTGDGPAVLLLHSFGFDGGLWRGTGIVDELTRLGRTVVLPDARGHGRSSKPAGGASYGCEVMAGDVVAVLDALEIEQADLAAFSMGAFVAARVLQIDDRIRRAVLSGIGANALVAPHDGDPFTPDLLLDGPTHLMKLIAPHLGPRIDDGRANAETLLDVLRGGFVGNDKDFGGVTADVLLLSGTRDSDPGPLADALPRASVQLLDADHATTMPHPDFVPAIIDFLTA